MQKIAIPVLDYKLSPHFANSLQFQIFIVDGQTIIKENLTQSLSQLSEPLVIWLTNEGITDVITRRIGHKEVDFLNQHKINVFVGVELETPINLIHKYIDGTLETNDNLIVQ